MLLSWFSSNVTPRIFLVTALLPIPASWYTCIVPRFNLQMAPPAARRANAASRRRGREMLLQRPPRRQQPLGDQLLLRVEPLRRHRHGNREVVADEVAQDHAGGANPERVLLAVEGDARFARGLELLEQIGEPDDGARRAALEAGADQAGDRHLVEPREIGLAVGRAGERKGLAHRRYRAQPLRPDHLVDEDQVILLDGGEVDGLVELVRRLDQERRRERDAVGARRGRKPQDGRPEPDAAGGRCGDQKLLRRQRGDDALHGRARQLHALRNLPEAQAGRLLLERAQNGRRARDDLDLALLLVFFAVLLVRDAWPSLLLHFALPNFVEALVSRFRSSHDFAARSDANFGIKGH